MPILKPKPLTDKPSPLPVVKNAVEAIAEQNVFIEATKTREREYRKRQEKADLPDHVTRILAIMWLNSHTRAKAKKQFSVETELYQTLVKWLEDHPV